MMSAPLLAGACVVPRHAQVRPGNIFVVRDASGVAVEDAAVTVGVASNPHRVFRSSETRCTDAEGVAIFPLQKEWEMIAPLMIHGIPFYYSMWCVEAPGFAASTGGAHAPEWGGRVDVDLVADAAASGCAEIVAEWRRAALDPEGEATSETKRCH